ncbi:MAG TPA: hypothetical protein VF631_02805 [Allosphingosinicella sp.]|uniref:hypothetical protein n=1 Tax=Allosphingosinicella sp. TaxID=2823234 RepID=UPI002F297A39
MRKLTRLALALSLVVSAATASASGSGGELHLVTMDEMSVPIVDGARTDGVLRYQLVIEAKDDEAASQLTAKLPLLRAASLIAAIEFARLYASPMMPVDASRFSSYMTAALKAQNLGVGRVLLVKVMAVRA